MKSHTKTLSSDLIVRWRTLCPSVKGRVLNPEGECHDHLPLFHCRDRVGSLAGFARCGNRHAPGAGYRTGGRSDEAVALLEDLLTRVPSFENAYVTIAKIHLVAGRTADGLRAVERLLQRNPTHELGLALAREYRPR